MSSIMRKILKNQSGADINVIGVIVPNGESYEVPPIHWVKLCQDENLYAEILNSHIVMNNGFRDLSEVEGSEWLKLLATNRFDQIRDSADALAIDVTTKALIDEDGAYILNWDSDGLHGNVNITDSQIFQSTVNNGIPGNYIALKKWVRFDERFLRVERWIKVGHFYVWQEVPFGEYSGINSLDATRKRFANDVQDLGSPYLVNILCLPTVGAGQLVRAVYTESKNLQYNVELCQMGWDFDAMTKYLGTGMGLWPSEVPLLWSQAIPNKIEGSIIAQSITGIVRRTSQPSSLSINYSRGVDNKDIEFLIPNVIIDKNCSLDYDYSDDSIRIEAYEIPLNHQKKTELNYIGYWDKNLMPIQNLIFSSVGRSRPYFRVGFKLRNMDTNQVSQWLPLKIHVRRGFRPGASVSLVNRHNSIFVRFTR